MFLSTLSYVSFAQTNNFDKKEKSFFYRNLLVPSTTIGLGLYTRIQNVPLNKYVVQDFRNNHFANFHTSLDDHFQYVPIVMTYGLHFTNLKSKSDLLNKTILLAKSELLMSGFVYPLKYLIGDKRPDGGGNNAFPSGHTTQAFVAAQFLYKEYGKEYPLIGITGYAFAVSTAIIRVLNNRHWYGDVLAGAGLGILTVNLVYLTHQYKFPKKDKTTPIY